MANRRNRSRLSSVYHRKLGNSRLSPYYRKELTDYKQWMIDNSKAPYVAFIDETYLDPRKAQHGFYSISTFVIDSRHVARTRDAVMDNLNDMMEEAGVNNDEYPRVFYHFTTAVSPDPQERDKYPWITEQNNEALLANVENSEAGHHYLFTDYHIPYSTNEEQRKENREQARGRALASTLFFLNQQYPGIAVIFEARNTKELDDRDNTGIERLKRTGLLPASFSHTHVSPTADPLLVIPDGTGWSNRRMQLNGEAERLTQTGIKQITFDAYSLYPIEFGPGHLRSSEPYKGPQVRKPNLADLIFIERGAQNKGVYISEASKSMTPTNKSLSPALNTQYNPQAHDYFMQGYNQSRAAQGNYNVAFAQAVYNKKLTKPQQQSYKQITQVYKVAPELIAQLPKDTRELTQKTRKQLGLLYSKTTGEKKAQQKEGSKAGTQNATGQSQQVEAQGKQPSEKGDKPQISPEDAKMFEINQQTLKSAKRNMSTGQQQSPNYRRPKPPTPGIEL